jgi:hypothetical protein
VKLLKMAVKYFGWLMLITFLHFIVGDGFCFEFINSALIMFWIIIYENFMLFDLLKKYPVLFNFYENKLLFVWKVWLRPAFLDTI